MLDVKINIVEFIENYYNIYYKNIKTKRQMKCIIINLKIFFINLKMSIIEDIIKIDDEFERVIEQIDREIDREISNSSLKQNNLSDVLNQKHIYYKKSSKVYTVNEQRKIVQELGGYFFIY